jgi:hypothetical protein
MPEIIKLASFDNFFSWFPLHHKAIISQPNNRGWVLPLSALFALASLDCVPSDYSYPIDTYPIVRL